MDQNRRRFFMMHGGRTVRGGILFHWKHLVLWSPIAASWLYMTRVVWARIVIEGIWGCYAVLRSKVLSLSGSLRNVKLLIFQEHLRTWYAQTWQLSIIVPLTRMQTKIKTFHTVSNFWEGKGFGIFEPPATCHRPNQVPLDKCNKPTNNKVKTLWRLTYQN